MYRHVPYTEKEEDFGNSPATFDNPAYYLAMDDLKSPEESDVKLLDLN